MGTGLGHRDDIGCLFKGVTPILNEKIVCRLRHGFAPNPTKIEIINFNSIGSGITLEIHVPKVFK